MALALLNPEFTDDQIGVENVPVRGALADAVRRMIGYCQRGHLDAQFIAKGLIIDTLEDIGAQMSAFFPDYTGVRHMIAEIEDKAKGVAQSSGQRYQHVSFLYVDSPSKLPKPDDAGKQHAITVYGENLSNVGSDASVLATAYKPPQGGGAAGGGANLLDHLRVANKIVFVLMFTVLDANDVRILDMLSQPDVAAAFAGSPEALGALKDAMMAGGEAGVVAEAVIQNILEIHGLSQAIANAPATPQGEARVMAMETTIAHKVERITADMPAVAAVLPAAVMQALTARVDTVKADMTARQTARVVQSLDQGFKSGAIKTDITQTASLAQAVSAVTTQALKTGVSVAAIVAATLTGAAPPAQSHAVRDLGRVLSQTPTLPAIETVVPGIREALITPVVQQASSTRMDVNAVVEQLQNVAARTDHPAVAETLARLEAVAASPAILQPMQMQAVADNLQALPQTNALPADIKAELAVIVPQVQVMAAQMRMPDMAPAANQVTPPAVVQAMESMQTLAKSSQDATIMAAVKAIENASPAKQAEMMSMVIQNLEAVSLRQGISASLKADIADMMPALRKAHEALERRGPVAVPWDSVLGKIGDAKFVSPALKSDQLTVADILRGTNKNKAASKGGSPCQDCFTKACNACNVTGNTAARLTQQPSSDNKISFSVR